MRLPAASASLGASLRALSSPHSSILAQRNSSDTFRDAYIYCKRLKLLGGISLTRSTTLRDNT